MIKERLLERIRHIEEDPDHRGTVDPNQVVQSIMIHLRKLLNTRQGSAQIADDYGVPDYTDLVTNYSSESVRTLAQTIRQVILKYEPRLSSVQLEASPKGEADFQLTFKLEGKIKMDENSEISVSFETQVDPDGKIQITS